MAVISIRDEILQLVDQANRLPVPIAEATDLYQDLHLDSLSFVSLLLELEERFGITIELPEMERCLVVGRLIELIETKVRREAP